jgi:hypothetical protein
MAIDFEQFAAWRDGKRVRIKFLDGEVAEVAVVAVALPNEYDNTTESWGGRLRRNFDKPAAQRAKKSHKLVATRRN